MRVINEGRKRYGWGGGEKEGGCGERERKGEASEGGKYPNGDNWVCTRVIEEIVGAELHREAAK